MTVKELANLFNQLALDEVNRHIPSRPVYFREGKVSYPIMSVKEEKLFNQDIIILDC